MNGFYYSSGQVARELGVSAAQVRALCASGAIQAETTPGGQLRVLKAEVDRFKSEGLPPMPRPMPADNPRSQVKPPYGHPALLAAPSEEVVAGAEDVAITENLLKKRKLDQQLEETEDWFRERQREVADQQAAEEEEERQQQAEEEAQQHRQEWESGWLKYAFDSVPHEARGEVETQIHEQVRAALSRVPPSESNMVVQRIVEAVVTKAVKPWTRRKEIAKAVEEGRNSLPYPLRGSSWSPTPWDVQACEAAAAAIAGLRPDASYAEMRTAAIGAVKGVVAQYEAQKAAKADAEMRRQVIEWASLPAGLPDEAKELAPQAIAEALGKLPQGTPRHKLEEAREAVLAPLHAAMAQHQQEQAQRAAGERRKREDRAIRESILTWTPSRLPWNLPPEQKKQALAAVAKALNEVPEFTPEDEMEKARDGALAPYLAAHALRERKTQLIGDGLRGIAAYIGKLEQDWDFAPKTAQGLELEIREPIRAALEEELNGSETLEEVNQLVRRRVRQKLGIRRHLAAA